MVPPSVFTLDSRGNSAAPAAGSFAHGGKGTKTPFLPAPSAGDFIRRAKLEWLLPLLPGHWALAWWRFGLSLLTQSAWLVPCCLAGQKKRAAKGRPYAEREIRLV